MLNLKRYFVALLVCVVISSSNALSNEEVITYIDISSQTVKVVYKIHLVNKWLDSVNSYDFVVDPLMKCNVSYIEASDEKGNPLHVNRVVTSYDLVKFNILFIKPILPGDVTKFKVLLVFINCLRSYPKSVKQNEKHFVLFTFNVYYFSSYLTEMQSLDIYPGNTKVTVIDGAKYKMSNDSKHVLRYGPYFKKEPKSEYFSVIHYENTSPFLIAEKIDRSIQISQWGYVTVINRVYLVHNGPKFVGPFERQAKQVFGEQNLPDTRIETITTYFPEYAFDIYVKDEIGLISSFQVDYKLHSVEVLMKPRFVLYGGWKTQYEIGYNLPIKHYVSYVNNLFTFYFPLIDKLFTDMVIKDVKLDIILPEGAVFQDISPHYELENNTNKYCYMVDFICRQVVSFKMNNLVDNHSKQNISLVYSFSQLYLLMKPIVVAIFLYVLFLLFLIYSHLTSKSTKENARSNTQGVSSKNNQSFAKEIRPNLVSQFPLKQQVKTKKNQPKAKVKPKKC